MGTPSPPPGFNEILSYNHILEVGGEADLYICGWAWGGGDVGEQIIVIAIFKLFVMKNIFSKCLLYIKLFHQIHGVGGGGGRSVYSRHTHLYIWGLAGGGGGVGWDGKLVCMKNISII